MKSFFPNRSRGIKRGSTRGHQSDSILAMLLPARIRYRACAGRLLAFGLVWISTQGIAQAQGTVWNAGPDPMARMDFAQVYLDQQRRDAKAIERQRMDREELVKSGTVSALDFGASNRAIDEFNRAGALMKAQNSKDAIEHLQKAIKAYPKFVSAYIGLGLAYADLDDTEHARSEFQAAAALDDKFPGSFVNLGKLALSLKDFGTAQSELEKAASLRPKDPKILLALAYAQNGNQQYQSALTTAQQVHALDHKGMANIHYVAASSAMALNDYQTMEQQLNFFLQEDPTNPLAPVARQNLEILERNKTAKLQVASLGLHQIPASDPQPLKTFPNSDRLKAELSAVGKEPDDNCDRCDASDAANPSAERAEATPGPDPFSGISAPTSGAWTIRKTVDEVALFFAVSSHGRMVNDLQLSDIKISDDHKPPQRVLQFTPQSKLPLRIGLLVDVSGSVRDRFSFEKHAAAQFLRKVLTNPSDLAFVSGFNQDVAVSQDFTAAPDKLSQAIEQLKNGGGTALFDAVSYACAKLAEYPDHERVARVLVVLSDGEDNSSHSSLRQTLQDAESSGVTVYTVSTKDEMGARSDADKVLETLAERTGGEAMSPVDVPTLSKSFEKLRDLIRSRYLVAYRPADFLADGKYRSIQIIADKDGKHLQVHARKGYYSRRD
jgi:Ca-activated chloride channel homolog